MTAWAALACPSCAGTQTGASGSLVLLAFLVVPALVVAIAALVIRKLARTEPPRNV